MSGAPTSSALPTSLTGATDVTALAAMGKVAFVLLVIVAVIFLCAWLVRRLGPGGGTVGQRVKVIAAKAVGTKERVVIVEVEGTWLVLGVTAGGISKLHEMPPGKPAPAAATPAGDTFAKRFAAALKQNLGGGGR
ncbi:MAG TPA: flagellar biosynthetic protein FliO [Rhodanobacteraceae bacterium]|nr:flagellar biosynthetic protein FliO [Rhodanobacteraceae bacterium]